MNYYKKFVFGWAALASAFVFANTGLAEEVLSADLSLNYSPGKTYYTTLSKGIKMDVAPEVKMNLLMVMSLKGAVKEHAKGVEVGMSYEGLRMTVKNGGVLLTEYDSAKEDNALEMAEVLDPMMKSEFSVIYAKDGKYLGLERVENLKLDPKTGITRESLESMMKQSSTVLPSREVKVGESWKSEIKVPMQDVGEMEISFDEKLVSIDKVGGKSVATIELIGKLKPLEVVQEGVASKIVSKEIVGRILFDVELQQIRKSDMKMDLIVDTDGAKIAMTTVSTQELMKVEDEK